MRAWVIGLAVILAGCSGGGGGGTEDTLTPDVKPSTGKGLIRGLVTDLAITPIPDATVTLQGLEKSTTTAADGSFFFNDLEPGDYFLLASKPGWSQVQQSATVVADEDRPPIVRLALERLPGTEPRAPTLKLEGFIACSIGEPTNDHPCDVEDKQQQNMVFALDGKPSWVQTEIQWDNTQPAGENLYVIQGVCDCPEGGYPGFDERFDETADAVSVHIARADEAFMAEHNGSHVVVDVSASGPALGTGLALNQGFTVYMTAFYNLPLVEDWSFVRDGDYPV